MPVLLDHVLDYPVEGRVALSTPPHDPRHSERRRIKVIRPRIVVSHEPPPGPLTRQIAVSRQIADAPN
jgi:hypothetical protein